MPNTYGISTTNSGYIDVSSTERGAKNYATRHGHNKVYIRFHCGYHVALKAEKVGIKWLRR